MTGSGLGGKSRQFLLLDSFVHLSSWFWKKWLLVLAPPTPNCRLSVGIKTLQAPEKPGYSYCFPGDGRNWTPSCCHHSRVCYSDLQQGHSCRNHKPSPAHYQHTANMFQGHSYPWPVSGSCLQTHNSWSAFAAGRKRGSIDFPCRALPWCPGV